MPRKSSCDCAHSQQFDSAGDWPFTMSNEHYVKWSHRLLFVQSAEFIRNEMDKHSNCSDEILKKNKTYCKKTRLGTFIICCHFLSLCPYFHYLNPL